jgi:hypothetical protein
VIAEDYLRMVSFELRDLPWQMRRQLVSELKGHLAELPPETDFLGRLGRPEQYAADLRAAAGLERRRGPIAFLRARRPRNLVVIAALLTLIGLAIGSVAWIQTYQPIASYGTGIEPPRAKSEPGIAATYVIFKKGRRFQYGTYVKNTGRFAVRVLGVPYPPSLPFSAHLVATEILQGSGTIAVAPIHVPFTLRPGEVVALTLEGVYKCGGMANSTSIGLTDFPVRFSFLWRTTTARVPLVEPLSIHLQGDAGCPGPTP